jgi:cellulose synthase/poly-beta-1,6-N-acetylglucosamine synthase-like glycosyltransferase
MPFDVPDGHRPLISVLAPARNEELVVGQMVTQMLRQTYEHWELFIIANNCTDRTAEVAREAAQGDSRVIVLEYTFENGMKADALNRALPKVNGEIVVEFDTDNGIDDDFMERVAAAFSDSSVEAVQTQILSSNTHEGLLAVLQDIEYMVYSEIFNRGREAMGLSSSIGGTGFAIRTRIIREMNGWSRALVEDFELFTRLVESGHKVSYLPYTGVWDEKPVSWNALVNQRKRWVRGHLKVTAQRFGKGGFGVLDTLYLYAPLFVPLMLALLLIGYAFLLFPGLIDGYAYFSPVVWLSGLGVTWLATSWALVRSRRYRMLPWVPVYLLFFGFHWIVVFAAALAPVSWSATKTVHGAGNAKGILPWIGIDGARSVGIFVLVCFVSVLWVNPLIQGLAHLDQSSGQLIHYASNGESIAHAEASVVPAADEYRVVGDVRDSGGATIEGATIVVRDTARGTTHSTTSDEYGNFGLRDVPVGRYEISVSMSGYDTARTTFELPQIGHVIVHARLAGSGGGISAIPVPIPY